MKLKLIKNIFLLALIGLPMPSVLPMNFISRFLTPTDPAASQQVAEAVGRGLVNGFGNAFNETNINGGATRIGQSVGGLFEGAQGAFRENGEFDILANYASGAIGRGVGQITTTATNEFGSAIQQASREGSQFDRGVQSLQQRADQLIHQLIHRNLRKIGFIATGTVAACVTVMFGIPFGYRALERHITTPTLITESSKMSLKQRLIFLLKKRTGRPAPMVFGSELSHRLEAIVKTTATINKKISEGKTNGTYRNLLLYGPPGTGKTMFAKKLAQQSGMEYACMSGSSFAKFKDGEGIKAVDALFAWAKKSKNNGKGLLIFIDEAESFLSKRENMDPHSQPYLLLNNFLNHTGARSDAFMLVFATNHKDTLDSAMYRRIDDLIEMPLPGYEQRLVTLVLYRNKILLDEQQNGAAFVISARESLDESALQKIARQTKGLSYADLEGIINSIKTDADILEPAIITAQLITTVVDHALQKHNSFTQGKDLGLIID